MPQHEMYTTCITFHCCDWLEPNIFRSFARFWRPGHRCLLRRPLDGQDLNVENCTYTGDNKMSRLSASKRKWLPVLINYLNRQRTNWMQYMTAWIDLQANNLLLRNRHPSISTISLLSNNFNIIPFNSVPFPKPSHLHWDRSFRPGIMLIIASVVDTSWIKQPRQPDDDAWPTYMMQLHRPNIHEICFDFINPFENSPRNFHFDAFSYGLLQANCLDPKMQLMNWPNGTRHCMQPQIIQSALQLAIGHSQCMSFTRDFKNCPHSRPWILHTPLLPFGRLIQKRWQIICMTILWHVVNNNPCLLAGTRGPSHSCPSPAPKARDRRNFVRSLYWNQQANHCWVHTVNISCTMWWTG